MSEPKLCADCPCVYERGGYYCDAVSATVGCRAWLSMDRNGHARRHPDCPVQCREDRDTLAKALRILILDGAVWDESGAWGGPCCYGLHDPTAVETIASIASCIGVDPERLRELLEVNSRDAH